MQKRLSRFEFGVRVGLGGSILASILFGGLSLSLIRALQQGREASLALLQISTVGALVLAVILSATVVLTFARMRRELLDREKAQAEIRAAHKAASDAKLALDQASILATTDVRGTITSVNDKFCEISGYSREELLGRNHRIINSGYHPPEFFRDLWATISRGQVWRGEIRNRAKNGKLYWVDTVIVPFVDEEGRVYQYTAIRNDITERKRIAEEIREREESFRLLAESMPQIVWRADAQGRMTFVNGKWAEYTGSIRAGLENEDWGEVIHPEDQQRMREAYQVSIRESVPYTAEFRMKSAQGQYRWFVTRGLPVRDVQGVITQWVGTITDVHEIKEAEEKLQSAIRARDEFLSIASHELKTPLTSHWLQVQMMKRAIEKNDDHLGARDRARQFLDQSHRQVSRLVRLVEEMLDVSRIQSGKLALSRERFDLGELADEVVERLKPQWEPVGSPVTVHRDGACEGEWDRLRLEQVVTNLLTNAMRYGKGCPIELSVEPRSGFVRLSVYDQGIGIAAEDRDRIFNRFERAISPSEVSGLGLGLFITQQIVVAHQGRVWVESEPGLGSAFHVELPVVNPSGT